jgi:amidophosphoribosyltransferase
MGLVADLFSREALAALPGEAAIGHVRYSTAGSSHVKNAQPLLAEERRGLLALAHNGNLTNAEALKETLRSEGALFSSTSDTEVILHLVARAPGESLAARVFAALPQVEGAYALLFLSRDEIVACRDPRGWRPLALGKLQGSWVLASESCAFDLIGAEFVRELAPGEVLSIKNGALSSSFLPKENETFCLFEHVYFARPDSVLAGGLVYQARKEMGRILADEHPAEADIVIPVPDSGVSSALGFSERSGLSYELGLIRNHYVGRTFIEPRQAIRNFGVRLKLNAQRGVLEGKRVAVIDDSLVRGTTSKKLVDMLRAAGAREVHMRIASPPVAWSCYYGIDTPNRAELLGAANDAEGIRRFIGADSLGYLSLAGLRRAAGGGGRCDACFSGRYPSPPRDAIALGLLREWPSGEAQN